LLTLTGGGGGGGGGAHSGYSLAGMIIFEASAVGLGVLLVFSFFASARSLQIGDGVAVIAVTSVAANLSAILAGLAVFGDRLGHDALVVGARVAAFALILIGAALIRAPVRAGAALDESAVTRRPRRVRTRARSAAFRL
jgi:hypothetical protein